ncbi:MAG: FG-GAP repeat protein [Flavobacteriales bacterium]|nr:FG-GAP repeat protein [Flavobacteriales bacterium]
MRIPLLLTILVLYTTAKAQTTTLFAPDGFVTINSGQGGFTASLDPGDRFSRYHDAAGDVNGDGVIDLLVGARSDDDGATDAGAVYILFMNSDGTVDSYQKISMLEGGFSETLNAGNFFGYGVAGMGDLDGDGIPDIAATAPVLPNRALYIIHLNADGTVKDFVKNSGIPGFGLANLGDLNNDGIPDLLCSDPMAADGGLWRGAVDIVFLDATGTVQAGSMVHISSTSGGFGAGLSNGDQFGGRGAAMLGDLSGDGTLEVAVGAFMSNTAQGAIWILSLDATTFNVTSKLRIAANENGFNENLPDSANFGHALTCPGDLNGDGVPDLISSANQYNEGFGYILYLNANGTVKTFTRINNSDGGFGLNLVTSPIPERFGRSISFVGDLRGDGSIAVNMGGGAGGTGTLYLLFFKPCELTAEAEFNFWSGGTILFSNWDHINQVLTGAPLTFEQCGTKALELGGARMTHQVGDGRCIVKEADAVLASSVENSTAYVVECNDLSTSAGDMNSDPVAIIAPNPTSGLLRVASPEADTGLLVRDIAGRLMTTLGPRPGHLDRTLDMGSLPPGVYTIHTALGGYLGKVALE